MGKVDSKSIENSTLWAAYGDALGFITELVDSSSLKRRINASTVTRTLPWRRNIGGRFGAEVSLRAGCYSDDTQLRLATSRAIRGDGTFDVESFAKIELTVWPSYALGAGEASRVAASSLAREDTNWFSNFFDRGERRYVECGGNGAAMRIQPHVWAATNRSNPETYLIDLVKNAICTHGHPRGILGGVFHALCLAAALESGKVPGPDNWEQAVDYFPKIVNLIRNDTDLSVLWLPTWEKLANTSIEESFEQVSRECLEDIKISQRIVSDKPEEDYRKIVEAIGGFEKESRGSGTKTAIIAAALGWLFRDDNPDKAIQAAANLLHSDTDTIASMAGAILGAVSSDAPKMELLDRTYIDEQGKRLYKISCSLPTESFGYPDLMKWNPPKTQKVEECLEMLCKLEAIDDVTKLFKLLTTG